MSAWEDTTFHCSTNALLCHALLLNSRCTNLEVAALQMEEGKEVFFHPPRHFIERKMLLFLILLI